MPSPGDLRRRFICNRCHDEFGAEQDLIDHLGDAHAGKSDGKYDYAVTIDSEFP